MLWNVEIRTTCREVYEVEADTREEAEARWIEGEPIIHEAIDSEVYQTTEEG